MKKLVINARPYEEFQAIVSKYIIGVYSIHDLINLLGNEVCSEEFNNTLAKAREEYEYFLFLRDYYNKCSQYTTVDDIPEKAWEEANHQYTDVELQKAYNEWEKKRLKCIGRIAEQAFRLEFVTCDMIYKFFENYHLTPNEVRIFWRDYYSLLYSADI